MVDYWPQKEDRYHIFLTVGGHLINCPGYFGTRMVDMLTSNLLFNWVLSTAYAKYTIINIQNFYFNKPIDQHEYVRIRIGIILQEIIDEYQLMTKVKNGFTMCEIRQGIYEQSQTGMISNKLITGRLANDGYRPGDITPNIWKHEMNPVKMFLTVDDFGV